MDRYRRYRNISGHRRAWRTIFERLRGRARLTETGRIFVQHEEVALASLTDGRDAVRGLQAGRTIPR